MKTIKVKTKFAGLVWFHQRYLDLIENGQSLCIQHSNKIMTYSKEKMGDNIPQKSKESFSEQYGPKRGQRYYLYGVRFIPDENQEAAEKKAKVGETLSQCPDCLSVEIAQPKGKVVWKATFVKFDLLTKKKCYPCSQK